MTKTLIESRFLFNKLKQIPKPQREKNQPQFLPNLQSIKQKILSGNGFLVCK